jgi:hypothetical protein
MTVPVPPEPPLTLAVTIVPAQKGPVAGSLVTVPAEGWFTTFTVADTVLGVEAGIDAAQGDVPFIARK